MLAESQIGIEQLNPFAVAGQFDESQYGFTPEMALFEGQQELPSADELAEILDMADEATMREMTHILSLVQAHPLLAHQVVPWWRPDWVTMVLVGGRGVGKTVCGATASEQHLDELGPLARVGIGAPTNSDARDVCMEGVTGLLTMFPHKFTYYNRTLGLARHARGGYVKFMGTEKPQRWNGPAWSLLWFDELALCNKRAWDDANLGLRLGRKPRAICTTTPKNRKWVKDLAKAKTTYVPHYTYTDEAGRIQYRYPTTFDNPYLPAERVEWLKEKYLNTRLGRQELLGQFIDDVEGAMWNRDIINHVTDRKDWPRFKRIVIGVDPSGSAARKSADDNVQEAQELQTKNADTGICVAALGDDRKYYILALRSGQWTPLEWAIQVIQLYNAVKADRIVAESNFGGLMVEHTIKSVNQMVKNPKTGKMEHLVGRNLPIKLVTASKGKAVRAEPVVSKYEQAQVIHCQMFGPGEDQMCAFVDADENEGADMVDALVWAVTELMGSIPMARVQVVGQRSAIVGPKAFVVR
jgi:phage terminase large subunit-like protein